MTREIKRAYRILGLPPGSSSDEIKSAWPSKFTNLGSKKGEGISVDYDLGQFNVNAILVEAESTAASDDPTGLDAP